METGRTSIFVYYTDVETANRAVAALHDFGVRSEDISVIYNNPDTNRVEVVHDPNDVSSGEGASFGALVGGITGAAVGLVAITIPGIGPVLAAGPLAAALGSLTGAAIGAGTGAVTGGVTAAVVDLGVSEEEIQVLSDQLRRGYAFVAVTGRDGDLLEAARILNDYGPVSTNRAMN